MALLHDILAWSLELPEWQRDALRRLLVSGTSLSEADLDQLYALFKHGHGIAKPEGLSAMPLAAEHIPTEVKVGDVVVLKTMRDLRHVNRIPQDQSITFSDNGLTVIYGGNAAGKSGFARVLKRACRSRDKGQPIHPDVNDPAAVNAVPSAVLDIEVNGKPDTVKWTRDGEPPPVLSSISVFDTGVARIYLTAEQDVAYMPQGLEVVEALGQNVLPALNKRLAAEIAGVNIDNGSFVHLKGDTEVGRLISDLSHETSIAELERLGVLSQAETERLAELTSVLSQPDPKVKAQELMLSVGRLRALGEAIEKPAAWVTDEAISKLQQLREEEITANRLAGEAANVLRSGEALLPGTGGEVWKAMFEAARRYSNEEGYPNHKFPALPEQAVCPLCQENLADGTDRLKRFEKYIQDDVSKRAATASEALTKARAKIEGADLDIGYSATLCAELDGLDGSVSPILDAWSSSIRARHDWMLSAVEKNQWSNPPALTNSPRTDVRLVAARQLASARTLLLASDETRKRALEAERNELLSRQGLSGVLASLTELVGRLKARKALEDCLTGVSGGVVSSLSKKAKDFASKAVSVELKKALDDELQVLNMAHVQTKLKERGTQGKMFYQLVLDIKSPKSLDEVLSEGEQRAIALASFFAELTQANHSCGVVFDDPVSSLDHWRRRNVAKRLVAEASRRQVIVFTHDTSFLGQLLDEVDSSGVPNAAHMLEWKDGAPGYVKPGLPFEHQKYTERIDNLEKAQAKLAMTWPTYPSEEDRRAMKNVYNELRATLERVIQDVVFNGVIKRYRDWIRVDALEGVVGFDKSEYETIDKLHKKCSDVVSAHDPASAKDASLPSASDLATDIALLKTLADTIKARRKAAKSTA